jgi:hypothetical protein
MKVSESLLNLTGVIEKIHCKGQRTRSKRNPLSLSWRRRRTVGDEARLQWWIRTVLWRRYLERTVGFGLVRFRWGWFDRFRSVGVRFPIDGEGDFTARNVQSEQPGYTRRWNRLLLIWNQWKKAFFVTTIQVNKLTKARPWRGFPN